MSKITCACHVTRFSSNLTENANEGINYNRVLVRGEWESLFEVWGAKCIFPFYFLNSICFNIKYFLKNIFPYLMLLKILVYRRYFLVSWKLHPESTLPRHLVSAPRSSALPPPPSSPSLLLCTTITKYHSPDSACYRHHLSPPFPTHTPRSPPPSLLTSPYCYQHLPSPHPFLLCTLQLHETSNP